MDFYRLYETFTALAFMGVTAICLYVGGAYSSSDAVVTNKEVITFVCICMTMVALAIAKLYLISLRLNSLSISEE